MEKRSILASAAIRTRAYVFGLVFVTGVVSIILTVDLSSELPEIIGVQGVAVCSAVIGASASVASLIQFFLLSLLNRLYAPRTKYERQVVTLESAALGGLAGGLIGGGLLFGLIRLWLLRPLPLDDSLIMVPIAAAAVMVSAGQVRFWLQEANRERDEANLQLQDRARQLEQETQATDKFLFTLAHESRTPLTSLRVSSDLLTDVGTKNDDPVIAKLSQNIGRSVRQMASLYAAIEDVNHVLKGDFAVQLGTIALPELLGTTSTTISPVIEAKKQLFKLTNNSQVDELVADMQDINRVLVGLLENASKYSPPESEIELNVTDDGPYIVIEVKDHGEGIPQDEQTNIFKPFYRVKRADSQLGTGAGFGLTVAKAITEAHGGSIRVESSPGQGSSFFVRLPVKGPPEK